MNNYLLIMMSALGIRASARGALTLPGPGFTDGGREDALAGLGSVLSTRVGQRLLQVR
jgi:hypothetical protein